MVFDFIPIFGRQEGLHTSAVRYVWDLQVDVMRREVQNSVILMVVNLRPSIIFGLENNTPEYYIPSRVDSFTTVQVIAYPCSDTHGLVLTGRTLWAIMCSMCGVDGRSISIMSILNPSILWSN